MVPEGTCRFNNEGCRKQDEGASYVFIKNIYLTNNMMDEGETICMLPLMI